MSRLECPRRHVQLRIASTAVGARGAVSVTDTRPPGTGPFLGLSLSGPGLSPLPPLSDLLLQLNSWTVTEMLFPTPGKENSGHKQFLQVFQMWNLTAGIVLCTPRRLRAERHSDTRNIFPSFASGLITKSPASGVGSEGSAKRGGV